MKKIRELFVEKDNSVVKAAIFYMVCQIITKGMAFITTPIFTRMMSQSDFGMVSQFTACEAILFPILSLNFRDTINKSKYDYKENNDSYLLSILLFSQIFTLFVFCLSEIFRDLFNMYIKLDVKYTRLLFLYIMFYQAFDYQQIQYNLYRKYKKYVAYSILSAATSLFLSVLLVIKLDDKAFARVLGLVIPMVLINIFIEYNIIKKGKKAEFAHLKYALAISIPLLPSAISGTLLSSSDRLMITYFFDQAETAKYAIAYTISSIAGVVWFALNHAWAPWMFDLLSQKQFEKLKKYSWLFSLLYISIIIILILVAPEILFILGGKEYSEALPAMPPVIIAMVAQFFCALYYNIEYFYGETYMVSVGTIIAGAVNIILNLLFIPKFGYVAASYTTMVGYLVMLVYHYILTRFKVKKIFVLNNRRIALGLIFTILVQIVVFRLYDYSYVRYIITAIYLLFLGIFIYKKRDLINEYRKRMS